MPTRLPQATQASLDIDIQAFVLRVTNRMTRADLCDLVRRLRRGRRAVASEAHPIETRRAYDEGHMAWRLGCQAGDNPYASMDLRRAWLAGFLERNSQHRQP